MLIFLSSALGKSLELGLEQGRGLFSPESSNLALFSSLMKQSCSDSPKFNQLTSCKEIVNIKHGSKWQIMSLKLQPLMLARGFFFFLLRPQLDPDGVRQQ